MSIAQTLNSRLCHTFSQRKMGADIHQYDHKLFKVASRSDTECSPQNSLDPRGSSVFQQQTDQNSQKKIVKTLDESVNPRSQNIVEDNFYLNESTLRFFRGALHTGSHPKGAAFSPDGRWLYIAKMYSPFTSVVDMDLLKRDPAFHDRGGSLGVTKLNLISGLSLIG